jgi:hypothetical protein
MYTFTECVGCSALSPTAAFTSPKYPAAVAVLKCTWFCVWYVRRRLDIGDGLLAAGAAVSIATAASASVKVSTSGASLDTLTAVSGAADTGDDWAMVAR